MVERSTITRLPESTCRSLRVDPSDRVVLPGDVLLLDEEDGVVLVRPRRLVEVSGLVRRAG